MKILKSAKKKIILDVIESVNTLENENGQEYKNACIEFVSLTSNLAGDIGSYALNQDATYIEKINQAVLDLGTAQVNMSFARRDFLETSGFTDEEISEIIVKE